MSMSMRMMRGDVKPVCAERKIEKRREEYGLVFQLRSHGGTTGEEGGGNTSDVFTATSAACE